MISGSHQQSCANAPPRCFLAHEQIVQNPDRPYRHRGEGWVKLCEAEGILVLDHGEDDRLASLKPLEQELASAFEVSRLSDVKWDEADPTYSLEAAKRGG